ncbi:PREDICTED: thyrotropin releasing hormone [Cyprinodon variegatus]|uniref:Pro-thyrotropin-releasing hormone n=1 Tax=Cyprinodon variegatus TaxID=28743 RepID=A0A3Q2E740_CYPVA|nr:PREDICTED: thyrotropin releasing hormone [Cyprinodon variegatus]
MKPASLFVLASFLICNLAVSEEQGLPAEDEMDRSTTIDNIILQRAQDILLRSILKKLQNENDRNDGIFSQPEWMTKRQHPGKRYLEDLEKRQHPGRREGGDDAQLWDVQKRQHPGKREDEVHSFLDFQKRQHPGKRSTVEYIPDNPTALLGELSKRQHPGKRYLVLHSKRQHPGKRFLEEEDGEAGLFEDGEEDASELEKRQHPGKRFWDNSSPELSTSNPCEVLDSDSCSKTSLLLDFLENIKSQEKRQHPGKRFAPEEDLEERE